MGHEERFPLQMPSVNRRYNKPTLARTLGNGSDAPNPAIRRVVRTDKIDLSVLHGHNTQAISQVQVL